MKKYFLLIKDKEYNELNLLIPHRAKPMKKKTTEKQVDDLKSLNEFKQIGGIFSQYLLNDLILS